MRTFPAYSPPDSEGTPIPAEERFVSLAASLVEKDWSTLAFDEAIRLQTRLAEVCERVAVAAGLPLPFDDGDEGKPAPVVFYHPDKREFRAH